MKFLVEQNELLGGLQIVQRAISSRSTLPILSGIYLSCEHNILRLRATDLEIGIECTIPVQSEAEGETVLPARYFVEIIKKLPNLPITIEKTDEGIIIIRYGSSEVQLNAFNPEEFPQLPQVEEIHTVTVNADLFINAIKQVSIAASHDISRPIFTGILLEFSDNNILKLVATDTYRLAYREIILPGTLVNNFSCIIPSRALGEIGKIFWSDDNQIEISFADNQVLFKVDSTILVSRLIEGQFPNYNQVIPKDYSSRIRVLTKDLLNSAERASLLARDEFKNRSNVIKLNISGNNLTVTSKSAEVGNLHEELPIYLEGEPAEIAFNARYLIDVLKVIDQEEIHLDLTGSLSPGIIRPAEDKHVLFLVLPIRI
ncbi:MAG: DNA polymerase III subunit beta [Zhaonellaceae bacterium]|jgi:DNA polymerase-3 subunit beta|nr:DNA polymerase III subunit beta [Clostridia bacterium]